MAHFQQKVSFRSPRSFLFGLILALLMYTLPTPALALGIRANFQEGVLHIEWDPAPANTAEWRISLGVGPFAEIVRLACGAGIVGADPCPFGVERNFINFDFTKRLLDGEMIGSVFVFISVEALRFTPEGEVNGPSDSGTFHGTLPTPPVLLEKVPETDHQTGKIGTLLPKPLTVRFTRLGQPMTQAFTFVLWSIIQAPAGAVGQQVGSPFTLTGGASQVGTRFTLGDKEGEYQVKALCDHICGENRQGDAVVFTAFAIKDQCHGLTVELSPSEVEPKGAGDLTTALITAKVSKPAPPGGCQVQFELQPTLSKGHDHGTHPKENGGKIDPISCTIEPGNTFCAAVYRAPEIAGEEKITAKLMEGGQVKESQEKTMRIRVPDLVALGEGQGLYVLQESDNHGLQNHYGVAALVQKVISLAIAYQNDTLRHEKIIHRLRIGNMSLPWGGLFDIFGKWTTPHKSHRIGIHVDMSRHVLNEQGDLVYFGTRQRILDRIAVRMLGLKRRTEDSAEECPDLKPGEPPCIHYTLN